MRVGGVAWAALALSASIMKGLAQRAFFTPRRTPGLLVWFSAGISVLMTLSVPTAFAQKYPMDCQQKCPVDYEKKRLSDGSVEYQDRKYRVSFTLPANWKLLDAWRWSDAGWEGKGIAEPATTAYLGNEQLNTVFHLYYRLFRKAGPNSPEEIDKVLLADVDGKISQRRTQQRLKGYRVRADSYKPREIGGRRALACVADFMQGKRRMTEYLVWVRSDNSLAEFFVQMNADQLDEIRERIEPILQSLRIP